MVNHPPPHLEAGGVAILYNKTFIISTSRKSKVFPKIGEQAYARPYFRASTSYFVIY